MFKFRVTTSPSCLRCFSIAIRLANKKVKVFLPKKKVKVLLVLIIETQSLDPIKSLIKRKLKLVG